MHHAAHDQACNLSIITFTSMAMCFSKLLLRVLILKVFMGFSYI